LLFTLAAPTSRLTHKSHSNVSLQRDIDSHIIETVQPIHQQYNH
jgi:hypothetical protein